MSVDRIKTIRCYSFNKLCVMLPLNLSKQRRCFISYSSKPYRVWFQSPRAFFQRRRAFFATNTVSLFLLLFYCKSISYTFILNLCHVSWNLL